ncbi:MAG TPA: type II toxin-antitoxin system RelE/ParE family toxin [Polyangiaceae bacterium]|nr:type II toxin-antitoxin system RelE/ParE family toxin [Polyangiaceae bacterium]
MSFRFSSRAVEDLRAIAAYTLKSWGPEQCQRYLQSLEVACQLLAEDPALGRPCEHLSSGLWRRERGRHVIFYRVTEYGIRVVAILHERMMPERHIDEDDDE